MKRNFLKLLAPLLLLVMVLTACSSGYSGINSYSLAMGEGDNVTYVNSGEGISEDSVFELGSNGKTVAAYIALKLVDEGRIDLDDQIAPYLDQEFLTSDPRMNDITLRQLLSHTAGFSPSYEFGVDKKIYSDPGESFRYSGVGYIYLQNVIENVSGKSLEEAAEQYVFVPLGMKNSTFEYAPAVTPYINLSSVTLYAFVIFIAAFLILFAVAAIVGKITGFRFYSLKTAFTVCFVIAGIINIAALLFILSKVTVVFLIYFAAAGVILLLTRKKKVLFYTVVPVLTGVMLAAGFTVRGSLPVTDDLIHKKANCAYSLRSTSSDMALFCRELMRQYSLDSGAASEMLADTVTIDDNNSWGLGIAIEYGNEGTTYWHSGINPGFQSLYILYPDEDRFIVVVTNSDNGLDFARETASEYLGVNGTWDIVRQQ